MPIRLNSILSEDADRALLLDMPEYIKTYDAVFASKEKNVLHLTKFMADEERKGFIGKYVFTLLVDKMNHSLNTIDADVTLLNDKPAAIRFLERLPMSSDANEYYDAETSETEQHFQLETVNRHALCAELEGTIQSVSLSAFPFKLSLYEDMDALNTALGFAKEVRVGNTDMKVGGFSDTFIAPGNAVNPHVKNDETYSFVIGTVKNFRDVSIRLHGHSYPFVIMWLETALGLLPTAANREKFDIHELTIGKVIAMCADIKADFVQMQYPDCK